MDPRQAVLTAAHAAHPERFVRHPPRPLLLPGEVWSNPPADGPEPRMLQLQRDTTFVSQFSQTHRHVPFRAVPLSVFRPCFIRGSSPNNRAAPISVGLLCVFATWRLCVKSGGSPAQRPRNIQRKGAKRGVGQAFQPDALDARPITLIASTLTAHLGRHCQAGKPDLRIWTCHGSRHAPSCRPPYRVKTWPSFQPCKPHRLSLRDV